jgi:hypothetical protein
MAALSARRRRLAGHFRTSRPDVRKRLAEGWPEIHNAFMSRIAGYPWPEIHEELHAKGAAVLPRLLEPAQRAALRAAWETGSFRSRVVMERHNYGRGEYKYFAYPLPPLVQELRESLYERLVPVAELWSRALGSKERLPATHAQYLARCRRAGQPRPTPLLLRYGAGGYNCLHQDLYGDVSFPLQAVFLLSEPDKDFEGGELMLVEQRPRMQSKGFVVPLRAGDAAVFANNHRPAQGKRGPFRVTMRHGVSEIRSGERLTLGVIFHDAA